MARFKEFPEKNEWSKQHDYSIEHGAYFRTTRVGAVSPIGLSSTS